MATKTVVEKKRGCGFKKPGGYYLIGAAVSSPCCKLPFPLKVCPCCGGGVRFSRGFTWITSDLFCCLPGYKLELSTCVAGGCVMATAGRRMGLMWVGESFYKRPDDFAREAMSIGISKRIAQIPKECKPGETWIALAHNKAIVKPSFDITPAGASVDVEYSPGVFMVFLLQAVQYVVTGQESPEELTKIEARGKIGRAHV